MRPNMAIRWKSKARAIDHGNNNRHIQHCMTKSLSFPYWIGINPSRWNDDALMGMKLFSRGRRLFGYILRIAHALHGKAKRLIYRSPVTGDVVIFDHDPF